VTYPSNPTSGVSVPVLQGTTLEGSWEGKAGKQEHGWKQRHAHWPMVGFLI